MIVPSTLFMNMISAFLYDPAIPCVLLPAHDLSEPK